MSYCTPPVHVESIQEDSSQVWHTNCDMCWKVTHEGGEALRSRPCHACNNPTLQTTGVMCPALREAGVWLAYGTQVRCCIEHSVPTRTHH